MWLVRRKKEERGERAEDGQGGKESDVRFKD
jgi:hypothetical protein